MCEDRWQSGICYSLYMSEELWQLYDDQGRPLTGRGANKENIFSKGLLHGAAHVWIWRRKNARSEILLQKRSANKRTWPNRYDVSAAGHIDLGESPTQAAVRETVEEIGVKISEKELRLICVHRAYITAENGSIENEFQWLYLLELPAASDFTLAKSEVASVEWISAQEFRNEPFSKPTDYVPHGPVYYNTVYSAIESVSAMIKK